MLSARRKHVFENTCFVPKRPKHGTRLINLATGKNDLETSICEYYQVKSGTIKVTATFLPDGKQLMLASQTAIHQVEIPSGRLKWQMQNLGYHRKWSNDGRFVIAETRASAAESEKTRFADTALHNVTDLPNAAGPYDFDKHAKRLLTLIEGEPQTFAIWDTATRQEISRFQDSKYDTIFHAAISPDGLKVVVVGRLVGGDDQGKRGVFLWNLEKHEVQQLQCPSPHLGQMAGDLTFSTDGKSISSPRRYPRWDVTKSPPAFIAPADGNVWLEVPESGRYMTRREVQSSTNDGTWLLFEDQYHKEIGRGHCRPPYHSKPSTDYQYVVIRRVSEVSWATTALNRVLRFFNCADVSRSWYDIVSLKSGRTTNVIPAGEEPVIGFASLDRIWTLKRIDALEKDTNILREWSCHAASPPWWLWLLTAGSAAGMMWEGRRVIPSSTCMTTSQTQK